MLKGLVSAHTIYGIVGLGHSSIRGSLASTGATKTTLHAHSTHAHHLPTALPASRRDTKDVELTGIARRDIFAAGSLLQDELLLRRWDAQESLEQRLQPLHRQ